MSERTNERMASFHDRQSIVQIVSLVKCTFYHLSRASKRCQNPQHNSERVSLSWTGGPDPSVWGSHLSKALTEFCHVKQLYTCLWVRCCQQTFQSSDILCIECRRPKPIKAEYISRCGKVFSIKTTYPGNSRFPWSSTFAYV